MNLIYHERSSFMKIYVLVRWIILLFSLSLVFIYVARAEDSFFSIALSKFSNEQDAEKEEAKLKKSGHNAFYREERDPDNKNTEYQVYIEKYNTRDEAEKEAMVLNALELISEYTVKEVRATPRTSPEQNTSSKGNDTEAVQIPGPKEVKKQSLEPDSVTEPPTTAHEPSSVINKPDVESPSTEKKRDQKPVPKTEQNDVPQKNITKPKPVINHDDAHDARLTGASLQVGSFKNEANAEELKLKLKNLGKNTFYRYESADYMGKFYRLYITGYSSLREAIEDAKALVKEGIISGYSRVLSERPEPVSNNSSEPLEEGKIYIIHISSNKDEANAEENVRRLKKYDYRAFYVLEKEPSGSWYRVYIGEFKDEADARKKGRELLEQGLISYFKPIAIDRKKFDDETQKTRKE